MRGNSVGVIPFLFYGVFNCSTVARSTKCLFLILVDR